MNNKIKSISKSFNFKNGINYLFSFLILLITFILIVNQIQFKVQIINNTNITNEINLENELNSISIQSKLNLTDINLNQDDDLFGLQIIGIKFTFEKFLGFIVYENEDFTTCQEDEKNTCSQYNLVSDGINLKSEVIKIRILYLDNAVLPDANLTIEQFKYIFDENSTLIKKELKINNETIPFTYNYQNSTYGGTEFRLRPSLNSETVKLSLKAGNKTKLFWEFNHTSLPENLIAPEQTFKERLNENIMFSVYSLMAFALNTLGGTLIGKKAKRVSGIPSGLSYIFVFFASTIWSVITQYIENYNSALITYSIVLCFAGIMFGMTIYKGNYPIKRVQEFDHKGSTHKFSDLETYIHNSKECILLDETLTNHPLWETFRRFVGLHRELLLNDVIETREKFTQDTKSGEFLDIESKGLTPSKHYELVVTPEARKYSRNIFDKKRTIQMLEADYLAMQERNSEMLANMRKSFRKQLTMILTAIFETIGEEYYLTSKDQIPDEVFQQANTTRQEIDNQIREKEKNKKNIFSRFRRN